MRHLIAALSVVLVAVWTATPASAEPAHDPRVPDIQAGYCPGGGMASQIALTYCDGMPYSDGTFWHASQYGSPIIFHPYTLHLPRLQCVSGGGPIPQPAPPGGCGGAVPPSTVAP